MSEAIKNEEYHLERYFSGLPTKYMRELMREDLEHYLVRFESRMIEKAAYPRIQEMRIKAFQRMLNGEPAKAIAIDFDRHPTQIGSWFSRVYRQLLYYAKTQDNYDFFEDYKELLRPLAIKDIKRKEEISKREREEYERKQAEERRKDDERIKNAFNNQRIVMQSNLKNAEIYRDILIKEGSSVDAINFTIFELKKQLGHKFDERLGAI